MGEHQSSTIWILVLRWHGARNSTSQSRSATTRHSEISSPGLLLWSTKPTSFKNMRKKERRTICDSPPRRNWLGAFTDCACGAVLWVMICEKAGLYGLRMNLFIPCIITFSDNFAHCFG